MKRSSAQFAAAYAIACAAAFLLSLSGCVSTEEAAGPNLSAVTTLLEKASPAALKEAAQALQKYQKEPDSPGANLSGLGRELYSTLYPRMRDNPFPGDSVSPVFGPLFTSMRAQALTLPKEDEKDFFALIVPCLVILDPSAAVSSTDLDAIQSVLEKADAETGRMSVLPPYLLGLLTEKRGAAGTSGGSSPGFLDPSAALSLYRESVRRDQSFFPGREKIAILLVASKQPEEAVAILEELSASVPQDASILKVLAQAYLDAGRPEKARDTSGRGLILTPEDSDLALIRARAFERTGDWYQALRVMDLLLKRSPDAKEAILEKARMLAESAGRVEDAVGTLEDARARYQTDPVFPEMEGRILLDAGRGDAGLQALNAALEIQPNRVSTLKLLLQNSMRTKSWMQAGEYLVRVLAFTESDDVLQMAFNVSWNLGEMDKAAEYAQILVDRNTAEGARLLLAQAFHAQGNDGDALTQAETGIADARTPEEKSRYLSLLASLKTATDPEGAMTDLRSALMEDPDNLDALMQISAALEAAGDFHGALLYTKHASELSPDDSTLKVKVSELEKKVEEETADGGQAPKAEPGK